MSGYCSDCGNTICFCNKERVFMCKYTGELFVKTNKLRDSLLHFTVLEYNRFYVLDWNEETYEDLGYL